MTKGVSALLNSYMLETVFLGTERTPYIGGFGLFGLWSRTEFDRSVLFRSFGLSVLSNKDLHEVKFYI
jgi:hypothetical protein